MKYTIYVRAFLNIENKVKAAVRARELFPEVDAQIVGKYWKDASLWEVTAQCDYHYADDKTALGETFAYLSKISNDWTVSVFADSPNPGTVVSAITESRAPLGLAWCCVELQR